MPSFSTDERELLQDSLETFFSEQYGFERWHERARGNALGFGADMWRSYAELGWLGVALPETAGGAGGGLTELAIVMAASGRHIALEPLLATIVLGAGAIELAGNQQQRESLLPQVAAGETLLAFCHGEPDAGYARHHVQSIARASGDGYVVDSVKSFALGAHAADMLIVSARLESENGPVALFLVPRDAAGLALTAAPALDGRMGAAVAMTSVHLPAAARLGDESDKSDVIDRLLDRGAIAVCAEACGAMAAATVATVEYLKMRQQFGQPLSTFQVLQHRLVDMTLASEEARAIVHAALEALDSDAADAQRAVWLAKVQTARSARFVGTQSIQLHGGMGMTDELAIGHFYKRLSLCETLFGDSDWYLSQLGMAHGGVAAD
jgi:alkylation response protein AidB-like acyl-CoA dehydrogenase